MNFKRCAISFAVLAVVLGGLALPASAQAFKGKFTLPYEAVWSSAVLQPGEYAVWTDSLTSSPFLHIEGNGKAANVLVGVSEPIEPSTQNGKLEITDVNGTRVVTRLTAASVGREYSFEIPRSVKVERFRVATLKKSAIPLSDKR